MYAILVNDLVLLYYTWGMDRHEPTDRTYRYKFVVNGGVVLYGFTTDINRREREHQRRWPSGQIEQVGAPTSHKKAWDWERKQKGTGSTRADCR